MKESNDSKTKSLIAGITAGVGAAAVLAAAAYVYTSRAKFISSALDVGKVPVTPSSGLGPAGPGAGAGAGSPAAPSNLQLTNVSSGLLGGTSATLSWSPPAAGAPQSYQIMKDGAPADTVPGSSTSTSVSDLPRDGVATLSVVPMGPGGAPGTASAPLSVGVPSSPGAGITLTATPASASSARLAWNRPQGGAGPTSQFAVLANGQQVATVPAAGAGPNTFTATGLQPGAPAVFLVVPLSPSGAPSGPASPQVPVTPYAGAGGAGFGPGASSPSAPSNLQLTNVSSGLMGGTSGTLSWSPPATGAPQSYQIVKDGVSVGTVPGSKTSATVSDLPRGGVANLSVVPISPGGAAGTPSPSLAAGIPSNPGSELVLTATPASASSAKLAWNRPQGGAGAPCVPRPARRPPRAWAGVSRRESDAEACFAQASYSVLQNGQPVATVPATGETNSFVATGLQPGAPAVFSVVPLSPSGSPSGPASVQVPVTPASGLGGAGSPGAGAPSAPSNVQLTNVSTGLLGGTSGTLSWNHPATGAPQSYQIMKDGAPVVPTDRAARRHGLGPLSVGVPSSPGAGITLTATPASASSARLAWNRPQGGAGPTSQFAVLANGQQVATVPAAGAGPNTFTATGLQPGAPAVFLVVPLSPSGAPSGPASPQVPVTPYAGAGGAGFGPGASSPSAPSNLQLTNVSSGLMGGTSATLSWSPPAAGAPQSYQVIKDGVSVGTVPGSKTSATVSDLPRGGVANLSVVPISPGGAAGTPSPSLAAGIPSNPGSGLVLTATPASASSAKLAWNRPQAAPAPVRAPPCRPPRPGLGRVFRGASLTRRRVSRRASYSVLQNGQPVATVPATGETNSFVATGLQPGAPAVFSVVPVTPASGLGGAGSPGAGAPSAPSNVQLTNVSTGLLGGTSGTLSWNHPATGAPQSYQIMKDGAPVDTVPGSSTSTSVSDLPRDGVATLSVVPTGPGGAPGTASAPLSVGVPSSPGAGITLTATPASASSARLAWNRPQGGAGPTSQFAVLKNGQQIATVPAAGAGPNTFTATGLQPNAPAAFSVVPLSPSGAPSGPASPQVPVTPYAGAGGAGFGPGASSPPPLEPAAHERSYQIVKDGVSVGTVPAARHPQPSPTCRAAAWRTSASCPSARWRCGHSVAVPCRGHPVEPGLRLVLTATPASASSAKLAWNRPQAAPAPVRARPARRPPRAWAGVSRRESDAEACFAQGVVLRPPERPAVATVPATGETNSFVATGLQPGAPAVFSVVPLSPSGSPSGPASVQVPVTPASGLGGAGSPGAGAPSAPSNVQLTNVSTGLLGGTSGTLSWNHPATGAPQSYQIMKDGAPVDTVPGSSTSTSVSDLPRDGVATLSVVPTGPGGAPGTASAPLSVGVPSSPGAGITLTATPASASSARLAWNRPQGGAGPTSQCVGGDPAKLRGFNFAAMRMLTCPPAPRRARRLLGGAALSVGAPSGPASPQVPVTPYAGAGGAGFGPGASSPSAPSNLQLTNVSSGLMGGTSATLSWSPPAAGAPQSYQVIKDGVSVGTVPGSKTSATVSDLPRGGVANLSVVPISPGGAAGTPSPSLAAGIPSNPGSGLVLTATPASASSAKLAWNRPQGGAGAPASYSVLQNGQPVATVPATGETNSFVATGLQPGAPAVFSVVPLSPSGSPSGPASVQVPVTPASGLGGAGSPGAGALSAPSNVQLTNVSTGLLGGTSGTLS
eukprot:tig00000940_g5551.t1